MNEHIKRFAEQATKVFEPNDPDYRYESFDKNKFAEMIVRECANYASRHWEHGHLLAQDLKTHFGVE